MEKQTIKLVKPIQFTDETLVTEVTIREPVAKDLRKLPATPGMSDMLDLAQRLSNFPGPGMIDKLCIKDTNKVLAVVGAFFTDGQETGNEG